MELEQYIPWIVGAVGVPVVGFLKAQLGWSGKKALWLTIAVSAVLAIVSLFATGDLVADEIVWSNVVGVFTKVFSAATIVYKQFG